MPTSLERRHNRRRRHERTRQELIEAALNQSAEGSFKDLTVEGVTREAGVARSAFYVYFGDKEELLLGALEDLIASHQSRLGRCWKQSDDPRRDIERGIYGMARVYADSSDLLALAGEAATYDEEVRELWSTVLETVTEGTQEEIERLQKDRGGQRFTRPRSPGRRSGADDRAELPGSPGPGRRRPERGRLEPDPGLVGRPLRSARPSQNGPR